MKILRVGLALMTVLFVFATATPYARRGPSYGKCNCWYWQSNQYGVIVDGTCETDLYCVMPEN
jgi:hypothetical protein